ncbi:MAG TPA: ABC transporter permease [Chitinophagaceae bacterium]
MLNKKVYSGINLLGLSIAAAFCMLVFMYMQQERSFDRFHKNADRLHRLEATNMFTFGKQEPKKGFFSFMMSRDNDVNNMLVHPYVLPDDIQTAFPEVEAVVRSQGAGNKVVWYNNESFKMGDHKVTYAEKNFFSVFDFPLIYGNAASSLNDKHNIVINQRTAKRLFGKDNPVGKTISFAKSDTILYTVSGVAKDFPTNSSYDYDMVMPLEAHPSHLEHKADRSKNQFNYTAILLLKKNTNAQAFEQKLISFSRTYYANEVKEWQKNDKESKLADFHLSICPFGDAHYNISNPWGHYTNLENIYQLAALALIILLIACVNYVLLTLTNTVSRSQEVGIRKTLGAERKNIVLQFLTETQILVLLSVVAGILICITALPYFNSLIGSSLDVGNFSFGNFLLGAACLFIVLGITAGFYPALVMSGMKPLNMLRKFSSVKINPVLSKALVVAQYAACVLLIISSLVIARQMNYMNKMNLGFDKEQVMLLENPHDWDDPDRKALTKRMYQYAATDPAIDNVTSSGSKFGWGFNMNGHIIDGKREMIYQVPVDFNYFEFLKIKLIKGRFFSGDMPTDSAKIEIPADKKVEGSSSVRMAIVVNETLYKLLGQPPLDEINGPMGARIIGVCDDYQFFNATQKVSPAYHMIGGKYGFSFTYLKIKPGQELPNVIDRIKTNWSRITGKQPFNFSFVDEEVKKGYESYSQWLKAVNAATILAVIIACLGLFGLSALYAVNRTKEVGIRKVMGASLANIFVLLNKDVMKLALIALVIAVPLAFYFMNSWLENFAYRIKLSWIFFFAAGCIGLLLAIIAVSYHSLKAAAANPVKSLRTE